MKRLPAVAISALLVFSLGLNGYLYYQLHQEPEVVYVEVTAPPPIVEEQPGEVFVYVSGCVSRPGVYRLPQGSRAFLALELAGGALPEAVLSNINLARILADGEQLHVPDKAEVDAGGSSVTPSASNPSAQPSDSRININTASQKELESLPGIGPVKAEAIIKYRTQNGQFRRIEDIMKVSGIGDKTFEGLRELIRVN